MSKRKKITIEITEPTKGMVEVTASGLHKMEGTEAAKVMHKMLAALTGRKYEQVVAPESMH